MHHFLYSSLAGGGGGRGGGVRGGQGEGGQGEGGVGGARVGWAWQAGPSDEMKVPPMIKLMNSSVGR